MRLQQPLDHMSPQHGNFQFLNLYSIDLNINPWLTLALIYKTQVLIKGNLLLNIQDTINHFKPSRNEMVDYDYSMKPIKLYSEGSERLQGFIDNRLDLLNCLMKKAESKINKLPTTSKAKCMKVSYRYPALLFDFSLCNDVHSIISLSIVLFTLQH